MELVVLILLVAGAVWALYYLKKSSLMLSSMLTLFAGACLGHAFFNFDVGPIPITIDRLLVGGLLLQYLVFRRWSMAEPKSLGKTDIVIGGFLFYLLCNVLATDWQYNNNRPVAHWLFFYLLPMVVYWINRDTKVSERDFKTLLTGFVCFGIYLCLTGIAETREWWFAVFPKHIGDAKIHEFLGRARGPFLNPISNGIFIGFGWCSLLMFWPRVKTKGRCLIISLSFLFAIGMLLTYTRSVWIACLLAIGFIVWVGATWRQRGVIVMATVFFAFFGWLSLEEFSRFKRDKHVSTTQMAKSAELRPMLAVAAMNVFEEKPLFGIGFRQYRGYIHPYLGSNEWNFPLKQVRTYIQHNWFLSLLTETGLVGLFFLVALLAIWTFCGWQLAFTRSLPLEVQQLGILHLSLFIMLVVNGMFHDTSTLPSGNAICFFVSGLMMSQFRKHFGRAPNENSKKLKAESAIVATNQTSSTFA